MLTLALILCGREYAWGDGRAFCREGACREEMSTVMGTGEKNTDCYPYSRITLATKLVNLDLPCVSFLEKHLHSARGLERFLSDH